MPPLLEIRWLVGFAIVLGIATPALAQDKKAPKRERNRISREELVEAGDRFPDVYQAIRSLRPHFLAASRGPRTTGVGDRSRDDPVGSYGTGGSNALNAMPVLWLDGRKAGGPETLKGIATRDVEEVRYLTPSEATNEYGLGHEAGAIVVKLWPRGEKP